MSEKKIALSPSDWYYLEVVKRNLKIQGLPNYVPLRIAFGRSIQTRQEPAFEEWLSPRDKEAARGLRGSEAPELFRFEQGQHHLFQAILSQRYTRPLSPAAYSTLLRSHIRHGLRLMAGESDRLRGYEYLTAILGYAQSPGQEEMDLAATATPASVAPLQVHIGRHRESQQPVALSLNTPPSPHMALVGDAGSGKTAFLKHLLCQIREQSDYATHFILFDDKDGEIARDESFLNATQAKVLDVQQEPLPINIFRGVGDDAAQRVRRVVELFECAEPNLRGGQAELLHQAILKAYARQQPYPDFATVREALLESDKPADVATTLLDSLIDQAYFARKDDLIYESLTSNTLVIDLHAVHHQALVVLLLLHQICRELQARDMAPKDSTTGARPLRTFVVICQAQRFLSSPRQAQELASIARDMRITSGGLLLVSPSPDPYENTAFNARELLHYALLLRCSPQSARFFEHMFGLSVEQARAMQQALPHLKDGEALLNQENDTVIALTKENGAYVG